jgi:hypothetical protein
MSWNIRPGQEENYFDFVVNEFGPEMMKLGVRPTDAWFTTYGDRPQILTGGVADDLESLQRVLASEEWRNLKQKLFTYVVDYNQKIVHATGRFQL